ncbi:hypothetical protein Emag_005121 [Eimeria magna]
MSPLLPRQLALLLISLLAPLFHFKDSEAFTRLTNPQRLAETPPAASLGDVLLLGVSTASPSNNHQLDEAADVGGSWLQRLRKRLSRDSAVETASAGLTTPELLPSPAEVSGVELASTDAVRGGITERIDRRLSISADLLGSSVLLRSAAGTPITLASSEAPTLFLDLQHCALVDEFGSSCRVTQVQLSILVAAAALLLLGLAAGTYFALHRYYFQGGGSEKHADGVEEQDSSSRTQQGPESNARLFLYRLRCAAAATMCEAAEQTAAVTALGAPAGAQLQVCGRGGAAACAAAAALALRHWEASHAAQLFLPAALAACESPHAEGLTAFDAVAAGKEETRGLDALVAGGRRDSKLKGGSR